MQLLPFNLVCMYKSSYVVMQQPIWISATLLQSPTNRLSAICYQLSASICYQLSALLLLHVDLQWSQTAARTNQTKLGIRRGTS